MRCTGCALAVPEGTLLCDACVAARSALARADTAFAPARPFPQNAPIPAGPRDRSRGDPLVGTRVIGQFVIRERLGAGGMGAVYLADQVTVDRPAVIKVLHPSVSRDPATTARFSIEARAASQLNHPNIVVIYNYGTMDDGTWFLAMEFLDGVSLASVLEKGRVPVARAGRIVLQVAEGLAEAHQHGVIHRDIKPSNIMLVRRGQDDDVVKVLDFGVAQVDGSHLTATGIVCGTPKYMSPEQLRSQKLDGRSDLYSLAVVFFELVTGKAPFTASGAAGYVYKHTSEPPPRASAVAPRARIPPVIDAFLDRTLSKAPSDRPADAAAFATELRQALDAADARAPAATSARNRGPVPSSPRDQPRGPRVLSSVMARVLAWLRRALDWVIAAPSAIRARGRRWFRPRSSGLWARLRLRRRTRRQTWKRVALGAALILCVALLVWVAVAAVRGHREPAKAEAVTGTSASDAGPPRAEREQPTHSTKPIPSSHTRRRDRR